ncbi:hypothetical protein E5Q_01363 [Mixia osmundae IAM 14324]|uniref:Uncharacterized protein n=1 Tax=Mixia osmundae (strain CBS 9802 / IAM 14324 / JCM 22182 / KY 12970) TaxID=764103 RepID=G7DVV0_MIXOS|nr:hypothetical protein E5Q_01363 [Mixia osmundae IAM 14324]
MTWLFLLASNKRTPHNLDGVRYGLLPGRRLTALVLLARTRLHRTHAKISTCGQAICDGERTIERSCNGYFYPASDDRRGAFDLNVTGYDLPSS